MKKFEFRGPVAGLLLTGVIGGASALASPAQAALPIGVIGNTWTSTTAMTTPRYSHTATTLTSGKVLVTGGNNGSTLLSSTEIYDPVAGTWTSAAPMSVTRYGHTATLLASGKVLVLGSHSAEVYDPAANSWTATGALAYDPDSRWTATLLTSGRVLVAGGSANLGTVQSELYDPSSNAWVLTGSMSHIRFSHIATRLQDGRVLVAGGYTYNFLNHEPTAELYDPVAGTWSSTGSLPSNYVPTGALANVLPNGQVLVAGGEVCSTSVCSGSVPTSLAVLYSPSTGAWAATSAMSTARSTYSATLLKDGRVLADGGRTANPYPLPFVTNSAAVYSQATGKWASTLVPMNDARKRHAGALLASGQVLVCGGQANDGSTLSSAELYKP